MWLCLPYTIVLNMWFTIYISGVSLGEGTGGTMSDEEEEFQMDTTLDHQSSFGGHDMVGFGPLLPTESERSLMEQVRRELKIELKQVIVKNQLVTQTTMSFTVFYFHSMTSNHKQELVFTGF